MEQLISDIIENMTTRYAFAYAIALSVFTHIILAPIIYFKITRKLDKIDMNLKYSILAAMPPLIQQDVRAMIYATYIIVDARNYRDLNNRSKASSFHFRKYCTKFDILLSYLHVFSLVLFGILGIIYSIVYMG